MTDRPLTGSHVYIRDCDASKGTHTPVAYTAMDDVRPAAGHSFAWYMVTTAPRGGAKVPSTHVVSADTGKPVTQPQLEKAKGRLLPVARPLQSGLAYVERVAAEAFTHVRLSLRTGPGPDAGKQSVIASVMYTAPEQPLPVKFWLKMKSA